MVMMLMMTLRVEMVAVIVVTGGDDDIMVVVLVAIMIGVMADVGGVMVMILKIMLRRRWRKMRISVILVVMMKRNG